ncbi:HAAS signaling domain-containing protein [Phytoactinopolyspora halotolerans]|uniref:Uncharacterized protein n=1 Tax=Phytoactinopolyspora halotolerans TaxID=1981512 RepID=A0A6L9SEK7_9ACTN|nr:hypothetical protein [Phytoactinopolyspora halotolerans]NEE03563.1 hypothetical protein [Phytoactinopolyspora halotolerans]
MDRYLAEVDAALTERGVVDRADIVASLREHIESALGEDPASPEDVDEVLASLGDPLAIAAEASTETPRYVVAARDSRRWVAPWIPAAVVALVMVGALTWVFYLPILVLLAGVVLLWGSALWTPGEKLLGTLLLPAPGVALWALGVAAFTTAEVCESESVAVEVGSDETPPVETTCTGGLAVWENVVWTGLLVAAVVAGVVAAVVLYRRGVARAL